MMPCHALTSCFFCIALPSLLFQSACSAISFISSSPTCYKIYECNIAPFVAVSSKHSGGEGLGDKERGLSSALANWHHMAPRTSSSKRAMAYHDRNETVVCDDWVTVAFLWILPGLPLLYARLNNDFSFSCSYCNLFISPSVSSFGKHDYSLYLTLAK